MKPPKFKFTRWVIVSPDGTTSEVFMGWTRNGTIRDCMESAYGHPIPKGIWTKQWRKMGYRCVEVEIILKPIKS